MRRVLVVILLGGLAAAAIWWARGGPVEPASPRLPPRAGRGAATGEAVPGPTSRTLQGRPSDPASREARGAGPAPGGAPASVRVRGTVLTPARQPAADVAVTLTIADAVARGTSGADGRFAVDLPADALAEPEHPWLEAVRGDLVFRRLVSVASAAGAAERDLGPIVLYEAASLDVEVARECAGRSPATLWVYDGAFPTDPPLARVAIGADGRARVEGLPQGSLRVVAAAEGCGRAALATKVPRPDGDPLRLVLGAERVVTVLVADKETEAGVPGATVRVLEEFRLGDAWSLGPLGSIPPEVVADAEGRARLAGLGAEDRLLLSAAADGYPAPSGSPVRRGTSTAHLRGGETEARLVLEKARRIRWPIRPGGAAPPDGTVVRLTPWTNSGVTLVPPEGRMEGGGLVVDGWGPGPAAAYARAPDGRVARLQAPAAAAEGYPTEFLPSRSIVVSLRGEDGAPLAGWSVQPFDQGNNPVVPPATTDESGVARIADLFGGPQSLVDVYVSPSGGAAPWRGLAVGAVDLAQQDGSIEAVIPSERSVQLLLTVDGRPAPLPPGGHVRAGDVFVVPTSADAARGEISFRWRPSPTGRSLRVVVEAPGYVGGRAEEVPIGRPDDVLVVHASLSRGATLRVRVRLPADGKHEVLLDRWGAAGEGWPAGTAANLYNFVQGRKAGEDGTLLFEGLEPGRYRAVDAFSGIESPEVSLLAGRDPVEVALDLSASGWVRGRVVPPEGEAPTAVGVAFDGERPRDAGVVLFPGTRQAVTSTGPDGTFTIRVPGNRPVRLRPVHSRWRPGPDGGVVEVNLPRDGVELRMVRGSTATVRFETPAQVMLNRGEARPVPVLLYRGEPEGEPTARLAGDLPGDAASVTFGGYEPGTYAIWIDLQNTPHAPVVLRNVTLGEGEVDLGTVTLAEGGSFTLEVRVPEGQSPPRHAIWLTRIGEPSYSRSADGSSPALVARGLGPGRFRVHVSSYGGAGAFLNEEITSDGRSDVRRSVDLTR